VWLGNRLSRTTYGRAGSAEYEDREGTIREL
jgi:hypothetical protein